MQIIELILSRAAQKATFVSESESLNHKVLFDMLQDYFWII